MQKSKMLCDLLLKKFGEKVKILKSDSPLYVRCIFDLGLTNDQIYNSLHENGISVINSGENGEIAFSVSSVSINSLETATDIMKSLLVICQ